MKKNYQAICKQKELLIVLKFKKLYKIHIDQYAIYTNKDIFIGI